MLSKHPDKCQFPHGHTRKVEVILEADELDENEMVCDFKVVKAAIGEFVDSLDHALSMNTEDPAYPEFKVRYGDRIIDFEGKDPTTEMMAKLIFDTTKGKLAEYAKDSSQRYPLRNNVRVSSIKVWETSSSWAEYSGS